MPYGVLYMSILQGVVASSQIFTDFLSFLFACCGFCLLMLLYDFCFAPFMSSLVHVND